MNENLAKFVQTAAEDEELQIRLADARDEEEAYAIASETVPGFTKEEFLALIEEIRVNSSELSLDDLEQAAGGLRLNGPFDLNFDDISITTGNCYGGCGAI